MTDKLKLLPGDIADTAPLICEGDGRPIKYRPEAGTMTKILDGIAKLDGPTNIYLVLLAFQLWPFNVALTDARLTAIGIGFVLVALCMRREKKQ